jgi:branched-chain amino acid transport system substrate-binding protein
MSRSRQRLAALGAAVALLTGACANNGAAGGGSSNDESGPLTIGVIVPMSGPSGPGGETVLAGIKAAVDVVNEDGGVDGRQVKVISRDDESTPAVGVTAANDLARAGADVIMGGWNSDVTLAIQPVLAREGLLNITSIPQSSEILGGADPNAIRMNAGNPVGGYVAAQHIGKELGAKRVAVMYEDDSYGIDGVKQFKSSLESVAPQASIVDEEQFSFEDTDFRVPLSGVKDAQPDAVFTLNAASVTGQPTMMKQAAQLGLNSQLFAATGTLPPSVVQLAGAEVSEGWQSAEIYFPDQAPFSGYEANKTFVDAFSGSNGGALPDKYAALGGMSVEVWAQAVEKAGTTSAPEVADQIKGSSFTDTVMGDVSFTDDGQMISDVYTLEVRNGELVPMAKVDVPDEIWQE